MSAPGQAGGDAGGDGQAQAEGQGGLDAQQIQGMLDANRAQTFEEMRGLLEQQRQPESEPEQQDEGLDLSWLDPAQQQPEYEDPQVAAMRDYFQQNQQQQQAMQQEIARQRAELQSMRDEQAATYLAGEFPELQDPKAAEELAGRGGLVDQYLEMSTRLSPEMKEQARQDPSFWRLVYMAHKTAEQANQEPGEPGAARLESGGGPGPAPQTNEDIVKGIMEAGGRGSKVLDFRV